jgi:hypothetical protein
MKTKILVLFWLFATTGFAQKNEEAKTIFGSGKTHFGYFISPTCQFGKMAGSPAVLPGIGAGVIFNRNLLLSLNYKFSINENTPTGETDERLYLHSQFAGLKGEYSLWPEKVVHLNFFIEAGAGEIELDLKDAYELEFTSIPSGEAWFACIEPGVSVEMNIWKYIKFSLTGGYRFVGDVTYRNLTEKDIRGFLFSGLIKFGLF